MKNFISKTVATAIAGVALFVAPCARAISHKEIIAQINHHELTYRRVCQTAERTGNQSGLKSWHKKMFELLNQLPEEKRINCALDIVEKRSKISPPRLHQIFENLKTIRVLGIDYANSQLIYNETSNTISVLIRSYARLGGIYIL